MEQVSFMCITTTAVIYIFFFFALNINYIILAKKKNKGS